MKYERYVRISIQLGLTMGFILIWEIGARAGWINPYFFGSPHDAYLRLNEWFADGTIWAHIRSTLKVLSLGFVLGSLTGLGVGIALGFSPFLRELLEPVIVFINSVPRLILQPFFVIWLGFGATTSIVLVMSVIWVLVAINSMTAFDQVPREIVQHVRVLGVSRLRVIDVVYLPSIAGKVISSSRATFGLAFQAAIVAEFVGGNEGLGYLIVLGTATYDIASVWAALVLVVIIGAVADFFLIAARRRLSRWAPGDSVTA